MVVACKSDLLGACNVVRLTAEMLLMLGTLVAAQLAKTGAKTVIFSYINSAIDT